MPRTPHIERHFTASDRVRDVVIGMSDWLTVPFELGLEKPDPRRALSSALTIGGAYVAGGFIPLAPYMALASAPMALTVSVVVTVVALGLFGWIKGRFTGMVPLRSAFQTMLIGGAAAAAAFAIARAIT